MRTNPAAMLTTILTLRSAAPGIEAPRSKPPLHLPIPVMPPLISPTSPVVNPGGKALPADPFPRMTSPSPKVLQDNTCISASRTSRAATEANTRLYEPYLSPLSSPDDLPAPLAPQRGPSSTIGKPAPGITCPSICCLQPKTRQTCLQT